MKQKLQIIHQDEAIVVVNKPPFLLSIPDRYAPEKPNVYHQLLRKFNKIHTLHRLDKETSGIMLFARSEEIHRVMSRQFTDRTIEKYYFTLVEGRMHEKEGEIDKPIAPHPSIQGKMTVADGGKSSLTLFKALEYFNHFTLVEANIKTGRTHQIRVHFDAIGYPLAIDAVYGRRTQFFLSEIKQKKYRLGKNQEERPLMKRSILHAHRLVFDHPISKEKVEFTADLPKDFSAILKQLRKWDQ